MTYALHQADCQHFLASEPTGKYDLLLIDPPYRTTNLAFDQAPALDWATWWPQAWRVLKPAGVIVVFAADLFTIDLIQSQRAYYRYRLVWEKTLATGHLDSGRRPMRTHEDILLFCQQPAEATYHAQLTAGKPYKSHRNARSEAKHYGAYNPLHHKQYGAERQPTSVLSFASPPTTGRLHPTQKPVDLLRWLLRAYSNPGETVLDCFAGSGSTLHACLLEGRHGVGVELDPTYYAAAQQRLRTVVATPPLFSAVA